MTIIIICSDTRTDDDDALRCLRSQALTNTAQGNNIK